MKKAIVTGITGQDGSYLAELLLAKGYEVHGLLRRSSTFNTKRIDHLYVDPHDPSAKLFLHHCDMLDAGRISELVARVQPDELYNLAAQSHVKVSFEMPQYTGQVTGLATTSFLEAVRLQAPQCRFYQASSSELFGGVNAPQNENSAFYPKSPYGVSKLYSYWAAKNYREAYGLFVANGILFNHESPRRGETFVTRKITRAVARIASGVDEKLYLGNLHARRDWGYAPEYVIAMWRMLQLEDPIDLVVGTGTEMSVQEFVAEAFSIAGLDWKEHVVEDPRYYRPTEVEVLRADSSMARELLKWEPEIFGTRLVETMVQSELEALNSVQIDAPVGTQWEAETSARAE